MVMLCGNYITGRSQKKPANRCHRPMTTCCLILNTSTPCKKTPNPNESTDIGAFCQLIDSLGLGVFRCCGETREALLFVVYDATANPLKIRNSCFRTLLRVSINSAISPRCSNLNCMFLAAVGSDLQVFFENLPF